MAEGSSVGPEVSSNKIPDKSSGRWDFLKKPFKNVFKRAEGAKEAVVRTLKNPSLGSEAFVVEGSEVKVSWSKFTPEQQESIDPTRAVIFLPGWPLQSSSKATWDLPRALANQFGVYSYNIDTVTPKIDPNTANLEARGIRKFILSTGIKEITIFGHSEGTLKAANLTAILEQENPQIKINGLVLASPMGFYPQNFLELLKNFVIVEPMIEKHQTNPAVSRMPLPQFLVEMFKGLQQDVKVAGLPNYLKKMLPQQIKEMMRIEPLLNQIKAPTLVLAADQDFVSNYRKYFPDKEVEGVVAQPIPDDQLRQQIINSKKWEQLPAEGKAKFNGDQAKFVEYYMVRYRTRERLADKTVAREQHLKRQILPLSKSPRFLLATRYSSHVGIPLDRYEQVAHVVSKIFDIKKTYAQQKIRS